MNESIQKANITDIIVAQRIRRELIGITELAEDINTNGLLNPVTVMRQDDNFRLLAGFRRLKACESLGWEEILVNIVSPADAEAALLVEISENVQREPLTFSQIMRYSTLLEDIEEAKAKERMAEGGFTAGRNRPLNGEKGRAVRPYPIENRSRDAIGKILGMSGRTYDRAKYIRENATPEVIARLDAGETSIFREYNELRNQEKALIDTDDEHHDATDIDVQTPLTEENADVENNTDEIEIDTDSDYLADDEDNVHDNNEDEHSVDDYTNTEDIQFDDEEYENDDDSEDEYDSNHSPPQPKTSTTSASNHQEYLNPSPLRIPKPLSKQDEEATQRIIEFNRLPPEEKVKALNEELYKERGRAAKAESELSRVQSQLHNTTLHSNSKIQSLQRQLTEVSNKFTELLQRFEADKATKSVKTQNSNRNTCKWIYQNNGVFKCNNDNCGFEWEIESDNPHEVGIKFCPGCGWEIC